MRRSGCFPCTAPSHVRQSEGRASRVRDANSSKVEHLHDFEGPLPAAVHGQALNIGEQPMNTDLMHENPKVGQDSASTHFRDMFRHVAAWLENPSEGARLRPERGLRAWVCLRSIGSVRTSSMEIS